MKKITENALLYRVNQLREKMAYYEAVGDGSQTPVGGLPNQTPNRQTPGNPGYNVKPAPVTPEPPVTPVTPTNKNLAIDPNAEAKAKAQANSSPINAQQPVTQNKQTQGTQQPEGHWYDPAVNFAKGVGDDLSYAADHAAELGQGVGQTAANMAKSASNALGVAGNFIGGAVNGAMGGGGTQGQQKVGANQGGGAFPKTPDEIKAFQKAHGLKDDGLIGPNTLTALAKAGIQPPAGFKMAGAKQPAPAPHPAQQGGTAAKPVAGSKPVAGAAPVAGQVMPNGSVSSGDADRDERLAQFGQVAQMTPDQQHSFYMGTAAQDAKSAGHPMDPASVARAAQPYGTTPAPATNKAPVGGQMQSTGDPVKDSELSKQGNTIVYKEDQDLARIVQLARW